MKVVGYIRVSSESQLDGFGLESQEKAIRSWVRTNHHRLVSIVADAGVSGATEAFDRPGLTSALQDVTQGAVKGIVVARLDRLARSLSVQEATLALVWRTGGEVFSVDHGAIMRDDINDPLRTALRQVVGVFAELDRRMVTKRLKDGRDAKAATGKKATGEYPYGYAGSGRGRNRDAVQVPHEQETIQMVVQMRNESMSYRAIAERLTANGVPPRRAACWSAMSVRSIFLRTCQSQVVAERTEILG
jgi:DNA invertase Pin-like site-specific DNA recombinase